MLTITVPGSSANIGPGFDSFGVAVSRYLKLNVTKSDSWEFNHVGEHIPLVNHYEDHFIYQVAKKVASWQQAKLPPCTVIVDSDIPLARGLGSSASAIIAGIELVNQLCELKLTEEEKFHYAVNIEGHADNVAPCLLGGFVVTVKMENLVTYKKLPAIGTNLVVYIPNFELKTSDARKVLPESLPMSEASAASAISNMMIAALLTEDYTLAGQMMEQDLFHESYRAKLIPNYEAIKRKAKLSGAFGTVISGAGPTMMSFAPKGVGATIAEKMKKEFPDYEVAALLLDEKGLQVAGKL